MKSRLRYSELKTQRLSPRLADDAPTLQLSERSPQALGTVYTRFGRGDDFALVYFISMSLIIAALAREATNDLSNTSKFTYAFALQNAAGSAAQVAINYESLRVVTSGYRKARSNFLLGAERDTINAHF